MCLYFRVSQMPELAQFEPRQRQRIKANTLKAISERRPWVSWVPLVVIWGGAAYGWGMALLAVFCFPWQDPIAPNAVLNPATDWEQRMLYSTVGIILGALAGGILAELVVVYQLRRFWQKEIPFEKLEAAHEPMH